MAVGYTTRDQFDVIAIQLDDNLAYRGESCGYEAGVIERIEESISITTAVGADVVNGMKPKLNTSLDVDGFLTMADQLIMSSHIGTPGTLPTAMFVGLLDAVPDAAGGGDAETKKGGWRNSDASRACGFWYDSGYGKWCCVYRDQNWWGLVETATVPGVGDEYRLRIEVDPRRRPKFFIDGQVVHRATLPFSAGNVKPYLFVVGSVRTLNVHGVGIQKRY